MEQYKVTGMSCAACQTRVEKAVMAVDGVSSCAVNLLTNSMGVEGNASPDKIIKAVEAAGYGASLKNANVAAGYGDSLQNVGEAAGYGTSHKGADEAEDIGTDSETKQLKNRLIASVVLVIPLVYVSMGNMMWGWPIPEFMAKNHVAIGIYELLLSGLIMVINQKVFVRGFKGVIHGSPNMDTLVALGCVASYCYSLYALFAMTACVQDGDMNRAMYFMDQFYFESAAMILTLITVGKTLEARSKGKTTDALKGLMKLAPKSAVLLVDGVEKAVDIRDVKRGDRFVVRPGDSIPVDGIVIEGASAVNESALTGESVPVDKLPGDSVSAATINTSGYMVCEATAVGEDTTLAGIIRLVSDAAATKAPIAKIADKVSGIFVPCVLGIALITFLVWILVGADFGDALTRAVAVLVISCPCALGLATPVAIMVGNGVAAKAGILFKTAAALEQTGRTQIIALDKTGTITSGIMKVTDVIPSTGMPREEVLRAAYGLENKSEHPIAKAICEYAKEEGIECAEAEDFKVLPGNGLCGVIDGGEIIGGSASYIEELLGGTGALPEGVISELSSQGKTPVLFTKGGKILGLVAVSDIIKKDSAEAIEQLKKLGMYVVMLTGDNRLTAEAIAKQAGVDDVVASVKPDGKESVIQELMKHGKVAMVGDGINDAPALTRADLGIAVGAGTDIAIDSADVVLMKNSLMDVAAAIRISRATLRNIRQNLFWAFIYNVIGIPLAAGCYVALLGWSLNPMFGAAAMGLSSFCVVTNALRLNLVKPYSTKHDSRRNSLAINCRDVMMKLQEKKENAQYCGEDENARCCEENGNAQCCEENRNARCCEETENAQCCEKIIGGDVLEMKIAVKGMMCGHCEMHVKKALESIEGIESATPSHEEGSVTITMSKEVDEELIKAAIVEAGYDYAGKID